MKKHVPQHENSGGSKKLSLRALIVSSLLSLLLGILLTVGVIFLRLDRDGQSMLQAASIIRTRFVGDYDWHQVVDQSLNHMVDSLGDRWSYYLTESEYQQVLENRSNSYTGIGITISREIGDRIEILNVSPGGPAEKAGIQVGEAIRTVDGLAVTAETWQRCMVALSGEEGSKVLLEIEDANARLREVTLTREEIVSIPVTHEMLDGSIGMVQIRNFYAGSGAAMIAAVDALTAENAKAIIFDLRDNPGGYVLELTKMLDHLLPEGVIFQSRDLGGEERTYTSDEAMLDLPFAVLVNAESYSAAEFFAAELRESAGAYVVGETTSGKGYAQQLFPLRNGSAIGLSTSRYFTGQGVSLIGKGVVPDAEIGLTEEARNALLQGKLLKQEDKQLQEAVRTMEAPPS